MFRPPVHQNELLFSFLWIESMGKKNLEPRINKQMNRRLRVKDFKFGLGTEGLQLTGEKAGTGLKIPR
jgi:hypothetical protein